MAGNPTKRVMLAADFPVHALPGFEAGPPGHHATWLPPLARELKSFTTHGWDFHWLTFTKQVACKRVLEAWGQTFHLLPRKKLSLEMLTGFRRERSWISRLAREIGCDLYHGWGTEQGYGYGAVDFDGISVVSMQGILQRYCVVTRLPWLVRLQARHERKVLSQIRELTVESPWGRDQLASLAPQARVRLLEYGISTDCNDVQRIPSSRPLALFVGSPNRLKGIDTLLTAFANPQMAGVQLVILGDARPSLCAHEGANVHFAGHVSPQEVRQWMSQAWCLVHPTLADTSPNCVKEARVIGLPVVTTSEGGQTQYVAHGLSGWLHAPGDLQGLIEGVLAVTRDLQTSLKMGSHGQQACRESLRAARTASGLLDLYQELLESCPA